MHCAGAIHQLFVDELNFHSTFMRQKDSVRECSASSAAFDANLLVRPLSPINTKTVYPCLFHPSIFLGNRRPHLLAPPARCPLPLELVQVIKQALLLQRLLYLPPMDALFELDIRGKVCGRERLAGDGACVGVLLQPLEDARAIEGVPVFGLDLR